MTFKQLHKEIKYSVIVLLKVSCEPGNQLRGYLILFNKLGTPAQKSFLSGSNSWVLLNSWNKWSYFLGLHCILN